MTNKAMERKLKEGECVDIDKVGTPVMNWPGHWLLRDFIKDRDYCHAPSERWVWSIGLRKSAPKVIIASLDSDLYQNPDFECLWLR